MQRNLSMILIKFNSPVLCFAIIVLEMYCNYKCSVDLPHSAVGWSAVCDCGISCSYSLYENGFWKEKKHGLTSGISKIVKRYRLCALQLFLSNLKISCRYDQGISW